MQRILIIDDNDAVRSALEVLFSLHELATVSAAGPDEGLAILDTEAVDLVVQDMNFSADTTSGAEGSALFHAIRERQPDLPVILLTAWTHLESAVELVRAGAADYMAKPWDDSRLVTTVRNLLELREMTESSRRYESTLRAGRERLARQYDLCGIVYASSAMQELVATATRVAAADVPVLITGANGAGKEMLADIVQANSACSRAPFIKVNVGALPKELIESELFGAEAGAFTGATGARTGRFEAADGGTLFLDEIANLSLDGQAKLLRVLQSGEFQRLGSHRTLRTQVRIISATNANLRAAVAAGDFREDLFYRLNVIELEVPPLVERRDDILPLASHFLGDTHTLDEAAEALLLRHAWPGNVRELQNCIRRARVLATDSVIGPADLGIEPTAAAASPASAYREPDETAIQAAMLRHRGIVARAARELGMSRQALYRRLEKFGIDK